MTLAALLAALERRDLEPRVAGDAPIAGIDVCGVAHDSRTVGRGDLFVAVKGLRADGVAFAEQAIGRGAAAIVAESTRPRAITAPWIVVRDARLALAALADAFYGHPSTAMRVVGITGTNGKTTTAYLLRALFEAAGVRCGLLGTVVYRVGDEELDAARTTPEAPDVQRLLRLMVERGCGACAMEVSSHALALKRVEETRFAAAVFTNLTTEHLDYHVDLEGYFAAKRRLFEMLPAGAPGVINLDDPRAEALCRIVARPVTYAINRPADVTPGPISNSWDGLEFDIRTPRGTLHARSAMVGRPNVSNILAAVSTAAALDLPFTAIERGLTQLDGVPGRFQVVSGPADDITVVVDYAHTDDALRNLLETARTLARGRVITVFGCGGDRDRIKRPLMGAVAARYSDLVVVTSDNPRSEDPARIIEDIKRGLAAPVARTAEGPRERARSSMPHLAIVDRAEAIRQAIELAHPGDLVLLAGKGHEKYQMVGDRTLPFDDVEIARGVLARRKTRSSVH
jgi:UDP-N-acetylmuramoyl-L-alanyl-D-glutamate--2,6-diaminopimelate ligase